MSYTKLDGGITESTIWQAPDATLRVWIAMLARADQHGYVGASMPGLAALSRVSLEDCIAAIEHLSGPDKWSRTKDNDGRRIAPADGGWVLLNHAKYRAAQNADDRRERSRVAMAELREKRKKEEQLITVNKVNQSYTKLTQAEAEAEAVKTKALVGKPTSGYDPLFLEVWEKYPKRYGNNSKTDAYSAWKARLKEGTNPVDIAMGVERYRAWCEASGKIGTELVMQAQRFFGRGKNFEEDFDLLLGRNGVAASAEPAWT